MNENIAIKVEHVSKKYCKSLKRSMLYGVQDIGRNMIGMSSRSDRLRKKEFWAIDDVSFEVGKGEILGIIGPNGAGKTTILKMLNGIFWPDKGKITLKGRVGALIEVGAGFHPALTGRENVYINAAILGMSKKEVDKKFDDILQFAEIGDFIDSPVKFYSSGMFVRLGFAVAVHCEPDILLVDEVLAVGDLAFQQKCLQSMKDHIANGCTVLFVSHNIRVVQFLCKKILLLNYGRIEELNNATAVAEKYLTLLAKSQEKGISSPKRDESLVFSRTGVGVSSVRLLDANDTPTTIFKMGERLQVEVIIDANHRIAQISLGITVWTQDDIRVATLSSHHLGLEIPEINGEKKFRCVIDQLNLMPGRYILRGGVYDSFAGFPYDQWGWEDRFLSFTVVSGMSKSESLVFYEGLGIMNMEFQWIDVKSAV